MTILRKPQWLSIENQVKKSLLLTALLILSVAWAPAHAFTVTSSFGWREHPISGKKKFHTGVDIRLAMNTPVGPVFAGKVIFAGVYGGYGKVIVIKHANKRYTLYGHLNKIIVTKGQVVAARQIMAYSGSTGYSTGPHLHLAYWVNGRYVDPLTIWRKP
jgi:murein DD-endopeptidase MepM/ murein hydrolase activator NlpD